MDPKNRKATRMEVVAEMEEPQEAPFFNDGARRSSCPHRPFFNSPFLIIFFACA